MGRALRADAGMVEWTISGYLIGFSLDQLLWGPIGDRQVRQDGQVFLFAIPSLASWATLDPLHLC
jgi:MFS family permease